MRKISRIGHLAALGLVALGLLPVHLLIAVDGDLDPTFGTGGKVMTDFATSGSELPSGLVIQADGKLVAAENCDLLGLGDICLARYDTDGSLDPTFGTAGLVTTDFGAVSGLWSVVSGVWS